MYNMFDLYTKDKGTGFHVTYLYYALNFEWTLFTKQNINHLLPIQKF